MIDLPSGWQAGKFALLNCFRSASIAPASFPGETFELYSVPAFPTRSPEFVPGAAIGSSKQLVSAGDVLICKINPRINRVWLVAEKGSVRQIASSEWIGFCVPGQCAQFYLYYYSSPAFREEICTDLTGVGGSLTRAQPKRVDDFMVPVAPCAEQQRIADKLDTVLARVDACRDRLDRAAPLLKRFRRSVLAAATSGRLTSAPQGGYRKVALSLLIQEPLRNGKSVVDGRGTSVLRLSSLGQRDVKLAESKRGNWENVEVHRYLIHAGDFLVSRGNGSRELVGRGALVTDEPISPMAFPDTMIRIRPQLNLLSPNYLRAIWDGREIRSQIEASARTTAGIYKISQGDLESLEIPLPSMGDQIEIVRRLETLFAFAARLDARLGQAQTAVDRLAPSLLAKAFRGELVPQDPADEPATELLKRLAAQRDEAPARRGRQRATV